MSLNCYNLCSTYVDKYADRSVYLHNVCTCMFTYVHVGVHTYVGWMDVHTYIRMIWYVCMCIVCPCPYLLVFIIYAHIMHGCTYIIHMIDLYTYVCISHFYVLVNCLSRGAQ